MNGRKKLGMFLIVVGVAGLAASGGLWRRSAPELARIHADSAVLEDSLARVHAKLVHQSLLLQGLNASEETLPDTVRRYGAGEMMEVSTGYAKAIRKLEMQERDINLDIASLKRDHVRASATVKRRVIPAAVVGAGVLALGLALVALASRRVGA